MQMRFARLRQKVVPEFINSGKVLGRLLSKLRGTQ